MTAFDFVFALLSIITSLGLTHLVAGFVRLVSHSERVRFSWVHALWAWSAFGSTIGNWGALWPLRGVESWPNALVLVSLAMVIGQYAFCALVTPPVPAEGPIDLGEFHERQHRRYAIAFLTLIVFAIAQNLMLAKGDAYINWFHDTVMSLIMSVFTVLAILVRARWAQRVGAITAGAMTTYFMIGASSIMTP